MDLLRPPVSQSHLVPRYVPVGDRLVGVLDDGEQRLHPRREDERRWASEVYLPPVVSSLGVVGSSRWVDSVSSPSYGSRGPFDPDRRPTVNFPSRVGATTLKESWGAW